MILILLLVIVWKKSVNVYLIKIKVFKHVTQIYITDIVLCMNVNSIKRKET